jgi:hypothetical protein
LQKHNLNAYSTTGRESKVKNRVRCGSSFFDKRRLSNHKLVDSQFDLRINGPKEYKLESSTTGSYHPETSSIHKSNTEEGCETILNESCVSEHIIDSSQVPVPQTSHPAANLSKTYRTNTGLDRTKTYDCYSNVKTAQISLNFNDEELMEEDVCKSPSPERRPQHPTQSNC